MKKRRRFTSDFKANVVKMILEDGKSQAEVAEEFDLHPNTINNWLKKHRELEVTPKSEQDLSEELKALKRRYSALEEEHEILKKAATYFAKNQK
ncbi:transposase [Fusibacter sp. JL216-2]|uniref:transposase n=1 Tax=Fusibacter sp. JL216-2 TaxID=3071453 RepID=UPI003D336AF4